MRILQKNLSLKSNNVRVTWKIIGYVLWIGAGGLMFIFWLSALSKWLGFWGIILAFILVPGIVIFPAFFWLVEKVFPTFYFILWGIGIVGIIILAIAPKNKQDI